MCFAPRSLSAADRNEPDRAGVKTTYTPALSALFIYSGETVQVSVQRQWYLRKTCPPDTHEHIRTHTHAHRPSFIMKSVVTPPHVRIVFTISASPQGLKFVFHWNPSASSSLTTFVSTNMHQLSDGNIGKKWPLLPPSHQKKKNPSAHTLGC